MMKKDYGLLMGLHHIPMAQTLEKCAIIELLQYLKTKTWNN